MNAKVKYQNEPIRDVTAADFVRPNYLSLLWVRRELTADEAANEPITKRRYRQIPVFVARAARIPETTADHAALDAAAEKRKRRQSRGIQ